MGLTENGVGRLAAGLPGVRDYGEEVIREWVGGWVEFTSGQPSARTA
jgi:hypothetical protein